MAYSTARATAAVIRKLMADGPNSFEPVGYRFGRDRATYENWAKAHLRDATNLATSTIEGADWDEVFATFQDDEPAAPAPAAAPEADTFKGYRFIGANRGSVWHLSPHNDESLCGGRVDSYLTLDEATERSRGICAKCSRVLDRRGPYVRQADRQAPAPAAPRRSAREALGAASAPGWELLYDKPRHGCEVGRRYEDGKPRYALICKTHGHVHELARLTDERAVRSAGGWCPSC